MQFTNLSFFVLITAFVGHVAASANPSHNQISSLLAARVKVPDCSEGDGAIQGDCEECADECDGDDVVYDVTCCMRKGLNICGDCDTDCSCKDNGEPEPGSSSSDEE